MARILRLLLFPFVVVFASTVFAACSDDDSAGPEEGASVEDIAEDDEDETAGVGFDDDTADFFDDPGAFVGDTVVISAEVQQVMSERIMTVGEEEHMLIVGAKAPAFNIEPGEVAQIKGIVGVYEADGDLNEALAQAVGPNAFDEFTEDEIAEIGDEFDNQNFIVATNIDLLETNDEAEGGGDDGLTDNEDEELGEE